jgi:hypothetical protein
MCPKIVIIYEGKGKGKGKAVPLQAWIVPEGSRYLRFTDFLTTAQDGDKVKVKQSRCRPGLAQRVPES